MINALHIIQHKDGTQIAIEKNTWACDLCQKDGHTASIGVDFGSNAIYLDICPDCLRSLAAKVEAES
jgi:hypothetical protein